jgi:hypothetical protein
MTRCIIVPKAGEYWFMKGVSPEEEPSLVTRVHGELIFYKPYPLSKPWMEGNLHLHRFDEAYQKGTEEELAFWLLGEY